MSFIARLKVLIVVVTVSVGAGALRADPSTFTGLTDPFPDGHVDGVLGVNADGSWIERCESPFHWRRFDSAGNVVTRYWASPQCLARGGVEIAAELWELFRSKPGECSMILMNGEAQVRELPGPDLLQMVEDKVIALYPAKYRIREESRV